MTTTMITTQIHQETPATVPAAVELAAFTVTIVGAVADTPSTSVTVAFTSNVPVAFGWQVSVEAFTDAQPDGNPSYE